MELSENIHCVRYSRCSREEALFHRKNKHNFRPILLQFVFKACQYQVWQFTAWKDTHKTLNVRGITQCIYHHTGDYNVFQNYGSPRNSFCRVFTLFFNFSKFQLTLVEYSPLIHLWTFFSFIYIYKLGWKYSATA